MLAPIDIVFAEGNSCSGSTTRFTRIQEKHGKRVFTLEYFGQISDAKEAIPFMVGELQKQNITRCLLIGSSFGGHMFYALTKHLLEHPELGIEVVGLATAGSPPVFGTDKFQRAFNPPKEIIEADGRPVLALLSASGCMTKDEANRFIKPAFGWYDGQMLTKEDQELLDINIHNVTQNPEMGATRQGILSTLSEFGNEIDNVSWLIQTGLPMLFIHAELDPVINLEYIQEMVPEKMIKVISNAHHYAHWTSAQEFSDVITSFIAEIEK